MSNTALVVMARYPELGRTKTRLARAIGDVETLQLYKAFLTDLAHRFAGGPSQLHWAYIPPEADFQAFISSIASAKSALMWSFPQEGQDLGARLHNVFHWTQAQQFDYTIIIGSDSPHISSQLIASAQAALERADVVLGPAEDGGYYLIAMRKPYDVFSNIPMSTSEVLRLTIELAERQGLNIELLETLFDVDELPELLRLNRLLKTNSQLAPATAAYLAENEVLLREYL